MFKNQLYIYLLYNIWCDSYLRKKSVWTAIKIFLFLNFLEATIIFVEWTFECKCALCVTLETCWLLKTTRFNNYTNRLSHTILFSFRQKKKAKIKFYDYFTHTGIVCLFDGFKKLFHHVWAIFLFLFLFDEAKEAKILIFFSAQ